MRVPLPAATRIALFICEGLKSKAQSLKSKTIPFSTLDV